jgi:hypothetical protein
VHVIPFPVNEPELWHAYVPPDVTQFIRHFSEWGTTKIDRLRAAGYEVVVLDEGAEKELSGADVRAAIRFRRRLAIARSFRGGACSGRGS